MFDRIPRWLTGIFVMVLLLSIALQGCGGGGRGPFTPGPGDDDNPGNNDDDNNNNKPEDGLKPPPSDHNIFGFAGMHFDADSNIYVLDRTPAVHYNLTGELSEPLCPDCIQIETIADDVVKHILKLRVTLRNPTTATYYDLRGIMVTNEPFVSLDNPDGYITLFDDGGAIEWNPYYAYCLEKDDCSFAPNDITKRFWYIKYTPGESMDFTLLVEGSYPSHCKDVTRLFAKISDDTYITPWVQEGSLEIFAEDWQWDIDAVHMHVPAIGIEIAAVEGVTGHFSIPWDKFEYTPAATYEYYIEAWSPNPDLIAVRQYGEFTVVPDYEYFESLPCGYPFAGINPERDNHSRHTGPDNFQNKKVIDISSVHSSYWDGTYGLSLRVSEDGGYYYSTEYSRSYTTGEMYIWYNDIKKQYIHFISKEGYLGGATPGGEHMVLHSDCLTTDEETYFNDSGYLGPGSPYSGYSKSEYNVLSKTLGFAELASLGGEVVSKYPTYYWYMEGDPIKVTDCLALPGGLVLMVEKIPEVLFHELTYHSRILIRDCHNLSPVYWADVIELSIGDAMGGAAAGPDGRIYYLASIGGYDQLVCADWRLATIWEKPIASSTLSSSMNTLAINGEGFVFVETYNRILAFDPQGELLWERTVKPQTELACLSSNYPLVVAEDGSLHRLNYQDGSDVWSQEVEKYIASILVDAEDKVYLASSNYIYLFDKDGNLLDKDLIKTDEWKAITNMVLSPDGAISLIRYDDHIHVLVKYE